MADRNAQPNFMNLKSIPVNTAQKVESDVLEPLTFSQSEATWEFAPKGFLHPGTKISIGLKANGDGGFPFLNVGVLSLIRRAVLRTTAGRVICDTDSFNYLEGIKSLMVKNSAQKEREQYLNGKCIDFEVIYDEGSAVKSTNGYGISNGREYNQSTSASFTKGLAPKQFITNDKTPVFSVALHQLFPYLKEGNQLPLFLMPNERIQVQLFWDNNAGANDNKNRLCVPSTRTTGNLAVEIDKDVCKIIADYVFFDGDAMEQFRAQNRELTFSYFDYRLSTNSLSASETTVTDNKTVTQPVRNIGGQGMYVTKVLIGYEDPNQNENNLLGRFIGKGMADTAGGEAVQDLESNLFINSEYLYPQTLKNNARQFHNLKETLGMVPFITREAFSGEGKGGIITTAVNGDFAGRRQDTNLQKNFFYQGFLTRGVNARVDPRGIDIHLKAPLPSLNGKTNIAYNQRAWLEIRRYATIIDGHLECYYV